MSKTTIRDVARQAGVGVGTVSRVLNDSPSVSEATRQKVLSIIDSLDYSPNLAARRLSRGKTMAVGVIVPFFTNPLSGYKALFLLSRTVNMIWSYSMSRKQKTVTFC